MIYDQHKLIHIAIPKTGTTGLFKMIHGAPADLPPPSTGGHGVGAHRRRQHQGDIFRTVEGRPIYRGHPLFDFYKHGHYSVKSYEKMIAEYLQYKKYKFFTFTRNPYDLMVSKYFYLARGVDIAACRQDIWYFKNFIRIFMATAPYCEADHMTQVDYLKNTAGKIEIDFIGKLENFENDWNKLRELIPTLPDYDSEYRQCNASKKRSFLKNRSDFTEMYDLETQHLVLKHFEEDFDTFKYPKSFPLPEAPFNWHAHF